jgi:2',3'-cyclic-nucleotide 2'-phosphodiesterase (5'-nucleotidase family)
VVGLKFLNPDDTVAGYLEKLKNQADIFIVLTHLGHPVERMMAEKVKGIDVIVGGHSHTKVMKPVVAGNTLVVQAWEHAKALGVLDLTIQDGKIVKYDGYLEEIKPIPGGESPTVQKIVAKYEGKLDRLVNVAIGEAEVDLDGQHVRTRETNLGNLITDIIRETTGATAAIINGGGIRTGIPKGVVKIKDVYTALPFDNYLVALRLTGREIREALEHGVSSLGEPAGRFPQVSGLRFTYSLSAPAGSRIREIIIGGGPLDPVKEYAVATHDFLIAGGDGYKAFSRAINTDNYGHLGGLLKSDRIIYNDASRWLRDVVIQYIQTNKKITARVEGRIQEVP